MHELKLELQIRIVSPLRTYAFTRTQQHIIPPKEFACYFTKKLHSSKHEQAKRKISSGQKQERLTISWARGLTPVRRHWATTRRWSWSACSCSICCCAATIAGIEPAPVPEPASTRAPAAGLKGTSSIALPGGWASGFRLRRSPLRRRGRRRPARRWGQGLEVGRDGRAGSRWGREREMRGKELKWERFFPPFLAFRFVSQGKHWN